jgi:hypothetical protein|tara:strand:- start:652 stop:825 length:174 start_codon:yes stop_codon:yes gene_type:complete
MTTASGHIINELAEITATLKNSSAAVAVHIVRPQTNSLTTATALLLDTLLLDFMIEV